LLRDARFTPRAAARFLLESRRRAGEQRVRHPQTARRIRVWVAAGAAVWAAFALAGREPFRRRTRAFAVSWSFTWLMLEWHIGMLESERGERRNLAAADACTLVRVWLAPAAADLPQPWMCALALASDGLDGRLARATVPTRLGRDLEGLADVAFASAALCGARRRGWIGRAAARAELARIAVGCAYTAVVWFGSARAPDPRVLHAARVPTPLRAGGLAAAGMGRRRTANALILAGAAWSGSATAAAVLRRARSRRSRSRSYA
jgi:hypothetical protein